MDTINPPTRRNVFSAIRARELRSAPASTSTSSGSHALNWAPRLHSRVTDRVSLNVNSYAASYNYVSNHGRYLAIGAEDGAVTIFDTHSDNDRIQLAQGWHGHQNNILHLEWTPDDRYIATASGDATCRLWDVMTKKCINVFKGHTSSVKSVAFSMHDPNMVVTGGRDGSVMIWDVRCTGTASGDDYIQKPTHTYHYAHAVSAGNIPITAARKKKIAASNLSSVTAVTYLPNNSNLMASAGASDGLVKFWDIRKPPSTSSSQLPTPAQVSTPPPQTHLSSNANHSSKKRVYGLCTLTLDPSGAHLFSACKDNSVHVYSTTLLSEPVHIYTSKTLAVSNFYVKTSVSPGPRGGALACASQDGVHVWGLDRIDDHDVSPNPLVVLRGDERGLTSVDWCKTDFEQLATCSDDCVVRVWNVRYPRTEAEEELGTFDDDNLDGNIEGMRHWVGWAQKLQPDEEFAVEVPTVSAVSVIGTEVDAATATVVTADIAPSAECTLVSPPSSRLGAVRTPDKAEHRSSSTSSSPETVVGSVTPERTVLQSVESASVIEFSPPLHAHSRATTLTPGMDQPQECDVSTGKKSHVSTDESIFQPNNDPSTDSRCPTPSCSNPATDSQKQLSLSSPATLEIPIANTPSVFEQMMRKREPSAPKSDDPRRKSFPNLSRKRDEKKDKANAVSVPAPPAVGASLQKKATLSSQRSFGALSSGLSANKQQNSSHQHLPLSRQSSTISNSSKSATLQSMGSNLGKRALSQCSSVGGSLPSLSMQSSCGHGAFRFSSCPFDGSSQDSTFSDTAQVSKRGRTDSMFSDGGIGLKREMSALSSSKAICGCGCPMVDEDMCKCVFEVSTVSGYDRKGKGAHAGDEGLFCLDLGMNKENICSFHWEKILGMDGRVV
ncbi:WD40-repeat-containing domain protein [Chytriomyces cf. hyalinus JEL632]|nr:WD40-repeat-containing domain protein [Chytriomyces cf. hyalinus JEL632]